MADSDDNGSEGLLGEDEHRLLLRNLRIQDYGDIRAIMDRVYRQMGGGWTKQNFATQIRTFPEGQLCIEDNGRVVAAAFALIVKYRDFGDAHDYAEITGDASLSTHDPDGDVLYGVDVFVDPDYANMRLGRRLYDARKELCRNLNLRAILAGGRMPGYQDHAREMSPQVYVEKVKAREIYDPTLSFQLSNDFQVKRILRDYLPEDKESHGYATLLEWTNIYYEPREKPLFKQRGAVVRVGVVQWLMRRTGSLEEFLQQVEFFVDALSSYQADLALFPEFFCAPLMGIDLADSPAEAVRNLAAYTAEIRDELSTLAVRYNINIVAGSMPVLEDNDLYNVAYLCRRDGTVDFQRKLHITPDEARHWVMQGGSELKIFDSDVGRLGILICYDVEYPELPRLLAERGMQILLVPYWTDTKNGYQRVRLCAQARAVENECYVVIAGNTGNLPRVENADIQYSQSAVFSPSDFAFPHDAIMAESTPNTEMMLIVDLDLDSLKELHNEGSVRNLKDRRNDLFHIEWTGPES